MADTIITLDKVTRWLDDLDDTLKTQIVNTKLGEGQEREEYYHMYHAAQLLRARMLQDFFENVEFKHNMYDEPQATKE